MTEATPFILEASDLRRDFDVPTGFLRARKVLHAVDGVSLQLKRGETLGIVGESGCGKSTLAKLLLGMLAPTAGRILYHGQSLAGLDRLSLTRIVQPVFQDPYSSLNPRKKIAEIIALPLVAHNQPANDRKKLVAEMLDRVGLPRRVVDSYPRELSGGQRQRVAIARALVLQPEVVICDEPTSALDVSVQAQILNLLVDLQDQFGLSYIFISHNLAVVEHLADRVSVMHSGRFVESGPSPDIFVAPTNDYTKTLVNSSVGLETRIKQARGTPRSPKAVLENRDA